MPPRPTRPAPETPLRAMPRWLAHDRRGATVVEFAMVCVPFFALMIAVLQITTTFLAQQALETASDKAVRQLMTGAAQRSNMTRDQFKTLLCSKLPAFLKCANVMIDVRTVTAFSLADTSLPTITYDSGGNPTNVWSFAPGAGGDITIARVMYIWNVSAGPLGFDISSMTGSRKLLTAINVFKTEPY